MSVFLSSLGRFPRWILSFRSSTKPPRGRPDCCLSPEPIETTTTKKREKNAYDDSKTKRVTPQSLVNSSHMREHNKYFNRLSRTRTSGKEKAELHKRKTLSSLSSVSRVCPLHLTYQSQLHLPVEKQKANPAEKREERVRDHYCYLLFAR